MSPSVASEAAFLDEHTFVPLNEEMDTTDGVARNRAASPRDIQHLIAPSLLHYSGSPLSRAGCVLFLSTF
jgi:hypothetical protein